MTLSTIRNFGISAHVDAGKTTLAERILFATGRIRTMGDVRTERPPTLDHDPQEAGRGITIKAAATTCGWLDHWLNIIDTPGHVDFTVEVERTLCALDGAVLVLCASSGVQAQTRTVERQMARYGVPRVAFVNKCDHPAADTGAVLAQLRVRLGLVPVQLQLPLGLGSDHRGVIDLIDPAVVRFEGPFGQVVVREPVPDALTETVAAARWAMLETLALHDDALCSALLDDQPIGVDELQAVVRRLTLERAIVPVLVGSALKNIGVQPLLDAVVAFLPSPVDRIRIAADPSTEAPVEVEADPSGPVCALAFKLDEGRYGQITWLRILRGRLDPRAALVDGRTGETHRVRRIGRLHAGSFEPIDGAVAGDVVAVLGPSCSSGTTLCDPSAPAVLGAMQVPDPCVERSVVLVEGNADRLSEVLGRFVREDPSLKVRTDPESGELRLLGMGELHLEVVATRLADDFGLKVRLGAPRVTGRLALSREVRFDVLLKKQRGGKGLYARLAGTIGPAEGLELEWQIKGGAVPREYLGAIRRAFEDALEHEADVPVVGARVVLTDGAIHSDDSSDQAFTLCAREVFKQALAEGDPAELTPIARVEVVSPAEYQGAVIGGLLGRSGRITESAAGGADATVVAEVPLARMFGYANALRSATSGTGAFSMDFLRYGAR